VEVEFFFLRKNQKMMTFHIQ